jgi:RNA polymerase sigma-70 factor (ECF subfamily)
LLIGFAARSPEKEREWMRRLQKGDKSALGNIYDAYYKLVYGLIYTILKGKEESEDCLQEVFVQLWEKADQFDPSRGNLYSFLMTMARNKAIDVTRSRDYKDSKKEDHIINNFTLTPESKYNNPHEDLELNERAGMVRQALKRLSEKEREVLHVAYFNGMTQSEISSKFDIPLGTVKYRMRQGMIKLKDLLASGINE